MPPLRSFDRPAPAGNSVSDSVAIAGPASPKALAGWLHSSDRDRALALPGLGGSAVNNLVHALLDAGSLVELVTLAPELSERIALEGTRLRILAAPYRSEHRARDFFREERRHVTALLADTSASVVNAQWTYEFALGALAAKARRPTIVTAHDAPLTILRYQHDPYRVVRTGMAAVTRLRTPTLAANSPYLASAWRRQMLYRKHIPVVPNAVMPIPSEAVQGKPNHSGAPIILSVSDAGRLKNVAALIGALPQVLRSVPEARLRLVGPGLTNDSAFGRLADRLGVRSRVELVGPVEADRVHYEYARAVRFRPLVPRGVLRDERGRGNVTRPPGRGGHWGRRRPVGARRGSRRASGRCPANRSTCRCRCPPTGGRIRTG